MPRVNKKAAASASTYSGSRSTRREDYTFFWTPTHVKYVVLGGLCHVALTLNSFTPSQRMGIQWYPASFTVMLTIEPDSPPEKNALESGRIERWGSNLLGKALVKVRSVLKEEEEENAKDGNGTE